ncbi:MAG TPA: head GIN domain-containing protein [Sphingomonas sp.]|nr:head GIN domain-containing protein [Sphingomonas sp.]
MRAALIALALLPLAGTAACHASWEKDGNKEGHGVKPSGVAAKRSYDANGFTKVELRGPDDIDIVNGAQFAVSAEGDSAVLDELVIQVVDGTLRVTRKERRGFSWGNDGDHGVKVHVTLPRLTGASLTGTGDMKIDKAEGDFHGAITGTGDIDIAALAATDADLSITGTGNITVAGTGNRLNASIRGTGDIDATKFTAGSASISILGPGSLKGNVTGGASISIAGPGDVDLTGGAKCSISATGPGEAHCS